MKVSKGNVYQRILSRVGHKYPQYAKLLTLFTTRKRHTKNSRRLMILNDFEYRLDLNDFIQSQMYYFGIYDKKGVTLAKDYCASINCRNALDIGANVGNHAIHLAKACDKLYCFEPNDSVANVFSSALNSKKSNIKLYRFGLSDRDETLRFYENSGNLGASSFEKEHNKNECTEKRLNVRSGDAVVKELDISNIDFIKIDVEGFEKEVLSGLRNTIKDNNPIIDFEYNSTTRAKIDNPENLEALLPNYSLFGTRRKHFGIFKEQLVVVPFRFDKRYSHVIAIPDRYRKLIKD